MSETKMYTLREVLSALSGRSFTGSLLGVYSLYTHITHTEASVGNLPILGRIVRPFLRRTFPLLKKVDFDEFERDLNVDRARFMALRKSPSQMTEKFVSKCLLEYGLPETFDVPRIPKPAFSEAEKVDMILSTLNKEDRETIERHLEK